MSSTRDTQIVEDGQGPVKFQPNLIKLIKDPVALGQYKKSEKYKKALKEEQSEDRDRYRSWNAGDGFEVRPEHKISYTSAAEDEIKFKEFMDSLPPPEPSKNSGGLYYGHPPPIHQPWSEHDFRFWLNLERPYDKRVMNHNWYNERANTEKKFITPLKKYLPDRYRCSEYQENTSYLAKYFKNFKKDELVTQLDPEVQKLRKYGNPHREIRVHQDADDPVERADRLNTTARCAFGDKIIKMDGYHGCLPRQPPQNWGMTNKLRRHWMETNPDDWKASIYQTTYQTQFYKKTIETSDKKSETELKNENSEGTEAAVGN